MVPPLGLWPQQGLRVTANAFSDSSHLLMLPSPATKQGFQQSNRLISSQRKRPSEEQAGGTKDTAA